METTEQEFTYLIEKHKSVIYTVCLMFSKDRDDIDDMFQEILIKLWNGMRSSAENLMSRLGFTGPL